MGLCIATREAVQDMKLKGTSGHIIHINSTTGHEIIDLQGLSVYGGSKFAVTALSATLINELAREKLPIKVTVGTTINNGVCVDVNTLISMSVALNRIPI